RLPFASIVDERRPIGGAVPAREVAVEPRGPEPALPRAFVEPRTGFGLLVGEVSPALESVTGAPAPRAAPTALAPRPSRAPAAPRAPREPREPRAPRERPARELDMEHARVAPVLRKAASEHVDQVPAATGSTQSKVEASPVADPPNQDLSPLIFELYARIKRELLIERE